MEPANAILRHPGTNILVLHRVHYEGETGYTAKLQGGIKKWEKKQKGRMNDKMPMQVTMQCQRSTWFI
jgi:hypothetical protein